MSEKTHRIAFSLTGTTWFYVCENCETPLDVDDKYCPNCGSEIEVSEDGSSKDK